jgi:hypothetical protein
VLTTDGPAGDLPSGRLVEELLITACLRHDLPELRRVLGGWARRHPAVGFDNLLLDGDTLHVIDPARPAREPASVLRGFARTLLTGGYEQPWRAASDEPALTAILLAVAGLAPAEPTDPDPVPAPPLALREHEVQLRRLAERLAEAADQIRHTEVELAKREAELRRARLQIATFSGKVGYRLTRLGARAARKAARAVRRSDPS